MYVERQVIILPSSDIDECLEDLADCTQLCDNTQGSFLCTCEEGYQLAADNFTCNGNASIIVTCEKYCNWSV